MIVGGKGNGKFVYRVYDASNRLFATVEGDDRQEVERRAEQEQRNALAPIMDGYKMTALDWNDPLLDITDDELLAKLRG